MFEDETNKKISITIQAINIIYENLDNLKLSIDQLEEINKRHELLIDQEKFWGKQHNPKRYLYDLQDFGHWLYKFLELEKYLKLKIDEFEI